MRLRSAKPGELKVRWGRPDRDSGLDICYLWGEGVSGTDPRYLSLFLKKELLMELEARGYDLDTFQFQIQKKKES